MIKYLGSKRTLIPHIAAIVRAMAAEQGDRDVPPVRTVLDLFSGTSRVGHALKRDGLRVIANDHNAYAHALARCYIEADAESHAAPAAAIIDELNRLPGTPGWFTDLYCIRSRFFHPSNGERIEAARLRIEEMALDEPLRSVVLVALMQAADRVDSTTGVQMAYLKEYAPRSRRRFAMRPPDLLPRSPHGPGEAHSLDAIDAAPSLDADLAYLDPPYNHHSYLRNYHIWETLVRWDHPNVFGRACKRTDCLTRSSIFNRRREAPAALQRLLLTLRTPRILLSFSDDGFIARSELESLLDTQAARRNARWRCFELDYPRYVGARIGIYNPRGQRVGTPGRLRTTERLYVVAPVVEIASLPEANLAQLHASV